MTSPNLAKYVASYQFAKIVEDMNSGDDPLRAIRRDAFRNYLVDCAYHPGGNCVQPILNWLGSCASLSTVSSCASEISNNATLAEIITAFYRGIY